MKLIDALKSYPYKDIYPMHMPGHKRNAPFVNSPIPYNLDITEIEGFDNLHNAEGILKNAMERAARLYGSAHSFYLINGSTCGILAGIFASTAKGDKVLISRNCHKAVYNAIFLHELEAVYLNPQAVEGFGFSASIPPCLVEEALKEHKDIKAVIINSPTYEGVISDIPEIAKSAHKRGIPLIVDEAHGAHLGFNDYLPKNSVSAGADIVIHSLHKTLPALTQSGLLHINGGLIKAKDAEIQLSIFESSSPSYILMAGIDACINLLAAKKDEIFNNYTQNLKSFYKKSEGLKRLKVFSPGGINKYPEIFNFDPGKIIISLKNTNISGPQFKSLLLKKYKIELEMALGDYALAMTSICDTKEGLNRLLNALLGIDENVLPVFEKKDGYNLPHLPERAMPPHKTAGIKGDFYDLKASSGRICLEYVYAYPPGIPILVPGEIISAQILKSLEDLLSAGVFLNSTYGRLPREIKLAT